MKVLLTLAIMAFATGSFAQEDVASMKKEASDHFDQKVSKINEAKACVQAASTEEGIKACKYDLHESMKEMKKEKMEKKEGEE